MSIVFVDKKMNSGYPQNTYIDLFCLILNKGNPNLCVRKNYNIDVIEFSKREDVQKLTDCYKQELKNLWKSRKKQFKATSAKNNLPTLIEESSNHPLSLEKNVSSVAQAVNPHNRSIDTMENTKIIFRLQNAKIGESYSAELQIQGETDHKKVVIKKVSFPDGVGLSAVAPDFRKIIGSPLKDGECKVLVDYQFQDASSDRPMMTTEFNLFINPDPKSLWQKKEPDPNAPYPKQNEDKELLQSNDNRVIVAASKRGRSHEHSGTFRDDDFLLAFEHEWDIIAVADGAGSAKNSRKGSKLAVDKSVEYLKNSLTTHGEKIEQEAKTWFSNQSGSQHPVKSLLYETFGRAAFAAVKAIEEEAVSKNANPKEYSTTLILAGHKKLSIGHFFAAYWVGDGGIGVYQKGKEIHLLGEVDSGEFAGQTRFLDKQMMTPEEIMKRLRFTITDNFTSLMLMTDGVTDPEFETDNNLARLQKWDELWDKLEPMLTNKDTVASELLKWLDFWSPGNHDDRTIALLY
ncbi:PP2C family serine/threonine-protein phosphatase [Thiothrix lacustris]|uniref:PP2C family serine/threonine-protein phosphatase n=1 Tax=Thiothrix lacustris TaxID=525917 RepID=UPI0027E476B3|nr:PP2C family serine/threonine-protein phosphatase [Thiothrix lacustris]WMP18045.1 PP2C family serine/threonine-protein phosphatase [Thiothrix lacustris]